MSIFTEEEKLNRCVDEFAIAMKKKLLDKISEGFTGWDKESNRAILADKLLDHAIMQFKSPITAREEIDIANLAMFLWYLNGRKP